MSKDVKEFTKAIDELRREIRAELRGLKESVNFCSGTCDDLKKIPDEVRELRREIQNLTLQNRELQTENRQLTSKVEELEQYMRSNNLEIKGAPVMGNPIDIVKKIGELVGEPVENTDIDICHRVPTQRNEKNIIVRFVQRSKRNSLLEKCKKKRLTTSDIDALGSENPMYVNEHLTRQNKQLLGAAIARKRETRWKFVWTAGGKVYAKKDVTSAVIRIANQSDIQKMIA